MATALFLLVASRAAACRSAPKQGLRSRARRVSWLRRRRRGRPSGRRRGASRPRPAAPLQPFAQRCGRVARSAAAGAHVSEGVVQRAPPVAGALGAQRAPVIGGEDLGRAPPRSDGAAAAAAAEPRGACVTGRRLRSGGGGAHARPRAGRAQPPRGRVGRGAPPGDERRRRRPRREPARRRRRAAMPARRWRPRRSARRAPVARHVCTT